MQSSQQGLILLVWITVVQFVSCFQCVNRSFRNDLLGFISCTNPSTNILQIGSASNHLRLSLTRRRLVLKRGGRLYESKEPVDIPPPSGSTELPLNFIDALERCASRTVSCIDSGTMLCRVDYDTSVGDMTYTSLKNTIPMLRELVKLISIKMKLSVPPDFGKVTETDASAKEVVAATEEEILAITAALGGSEPVQLTTATGSDTSNTSTSSEITDESSDISEGSTTAPVVSSESQQMVAAVEEKKESQPFPIKRSLRIFYPDMGEAVLARREWKLGTELAEVPPCVFTANIQNDELIETDVLAIILCPQYSETDYVQRILDMCTEQSIPCLMINPALINMDQGFGARARNVKKMILSRFTTTYLLKTLAEGALVREWPRGYTLWAEDESIEGGYVSLKTYSSEPTREEINDQFDLRSDPNLLKQRQQANVVAAGIYEVVGFFKGLSRF